MNLKSNPEVSQLKELIGKCDDENSNHIIWIAKNGSVHIYATTLSNPIHEFENENGKNLQFWKGVYFMGDLYFGIEASNDSKYLQDLYDNLIKNWNSEVYGHIDD
jgi:hypothetical protein